jgi:hypothetical protein
MLEKKEAEEAKVAMTEKKRIAQEATRKEAEKARKKEQEDATTRLNISIAKKMQLEEKARQKAWEVHLHRIEMAKHQSLRDEHDKTDSEKAYLPGRRR